MDRSLRKTAQYFGITQPQLMKLMREKGLLTDSNLPAYPFRDRAYLQIKDGRWYHATAGMQYSQSTQVKQAGIHWLAEQLGIELPPPPEDVRHVA